MPKRKLSASLEDYLEAIYHAVEQHRAARAKDLVQRLGVSGASVTGALRTLATRGLINYAPYELISLTPKGEATARNIIRRHDVLQDFFTRVLAVDPDATEEAACKMEHAMSQDMLERFTQFVDFVENCPRSGVSWIEMFSKYCAANGPGRRCRKCVARMNEAFQSGK